VYFVRFLRLRPLLACALACSRPNMPPGAAVKVPYDTGNPAVRAAAAGGPVRLGSAYDAAVGTPDQCLGHPVGAQPAAPEAIVACFRGWAKSSPRVKVERYAASFEGRELVRAVITSPTNHARLDAILADIHALAEPRRKGAKDAAERIAKASPVVAWFGYSIHGDEISGADASLVFGHHLAAATDKEVAELLDRVVVVIDPVMNPDGRTRILSQIAQTSSSVPSLNFDGMHRGWWPYGRGNHYLFDMNRDWIVGSAPETQGRWAQILRFRPQLLVDAHEMGSLDTYLFYPQNDPHLPALPASLERWQKMFAADQAAAFDAMGWTYYTREWADAWYPGYTDAWASLHGAVGMLYEQAGIAGRPLKRASGRVVTYSESVLQQAVSSLSNLKTCARNREALLRDFAGFHREPLGNRSAFALVPGRSPDRERRLLLSLMRQGIEVYRADGTVTGRNARSALGDKAGSREFKKGTYLVPAGQPNGALVRALLDFDPRLDEKSLVREREEIERKAESRLYDITAWNLGMAFALDAWWVDEARGKLVQVTELAEPPGGVVAPAGGRPAVAWLVDGRNDGSLAFAVAALERGLEVHAADKEVSAAGQAFARGTILIRRADNPADVDKRVAAAARAARVRAIASSTSRSPDDGPDLGGTHFHRLVAPRIGVLAGAPIDTDSYGHVWYLLDRDLGTPVTLIESVGLGDLDLRRYNVLVIPPASEELAATLASHKEALGDWVRGGGTLIALGSAAGMVAEPKLGLTRIRDRKDALEELGLYAKASKREIGSQAVKVDPKKVWDWSEEAAKEKAREKDKDKKKKKPDDAKDDKKDKEDGDDKGDKKELEIEDAWIRRFAPHGAILRGMVDVDHWLTFGLTAEVPVPVDGELVLVSRAPIQAPVRLAPAARLRLSGLLWPEARAAWAGSSWVAVESAGSGQVILFATPPAMRLLFRGAARMLGNAMVLGPAMGASQPIAW
jgi:hypothetical protein